MPDSIVSKIRTLHIWANQLESANDYYEEILSLPVANSETMLKSDLIVLGRPDLLCQCLG